MQFNGLTMLFGIFNNLPVGLAPCYLVAKTEEIHSLQLELLASNFNEKTIMQTLIYELVF